MSTGSGDAAYDAELSWSQSRYRGGSGSSTPAPDDGPGPTFNSIDGESLTPEVDNLYADHTLDRFDDSDVGDIGDFDPATESLADDSSYYAGPVNEGDVTDNG